MKKLITLLTICILYSFTTDKKFETPEDLGKEIFELVKTRDLDGLLKLVATGKEVATTVDKSGQSGTEMTSFKDELVKKIDGDKKKTKSSVTDGYESITADIKERKCAKDITLVKITPAVRKLKNYPIELGQLEIEYKCGSGTRIITVEIINTWQGWKILENLRLRSVDEVAYTTNQSSCPNEVKNMDFKLSFCPDQDWKTEAKGPYLIVSKDKIRISIFKQKLTDKSSAESEAVGQLEADLKDESYHNRKEIKREKLIIDGADAFLIMTHMPADNKDGHFQNETTFMSIFYNNDGYRFVINNNCYSADCSQNIKMFMDLATRLKLE